MACRHLQSPGSLYGRSLHLQSPWSLYGRSLHLQSPWSLYGRSLHLTFVTKWSRSWSWMTYSHPFAQSQSALPFWDTAISKFDHENPWSRSCVWSKVKVIFEHGNSKVQVMATVNLLVTFVAFRSIDMFAFHPWQLDHSRSRSWPRQTWWSHLRPKVQSICLLFVPWVAIGNFFSGYSKFHIWPWNFKVKVMTKVKPDCHLWGIEFNRYVCF